MAGKEVKAKVSGKYKHGATGFSVDKLMVGRLIVPILVYAASFRTVFVDICAELICIFDIWRDIP